MSEKITQGLDLPEKPRAWVLFGMGGHESEYTFTIEEQLQGASRDESAIFYDIREALENILGKKKWHIVSRGTRIEITGLEPYGSRDDAAINSALEKILDGKYDFTPVKS